MASSDLDRAYSRMSDAQRRAVGHSANAALLAGPGSGKTDTLVLKAAHLVRDVLPPTRSVAVLTYNNDTAREIDQRTRLFGLSSRRLWIGTIHSFALNMILRAFGPLCDPPIAPRQVITAVTDRQYWIEAYDEAGFLENPEWTTERRLRARRALAVGDDVSYEDDRLIAACIAFDRNLDNNGLIDFEGMVLRAYEILRTNADIASILTHKFPWILIDEYQDLGVVLHRLVGLLVRSGARILAAGDPDQSIYGFTGAEPSLLKELARNGEFTPIDLEFNYRSGTHIIEASLAVLGESRHHRPSPDQRQSGIVVSIDVPGGLAEQARYVAESALPEIVESGLRLEDAAILYGSKGLVPDVLRAALDDAGIGYVAEREQRFPGGRIGRWFQRCARRAVDPDSSDAEQLSLLLADVSQWCSSNSGMDGVPGLRRLWTVIRAGSASGARLGDWIAFAESELQLASQIAVSSMPADAADLSELYGAVRSEPLVSTLVADYAEGARVVGKVVLTTYHSSKGRQFECVILPALQEQLMPRLYWDPTIRRMTTSPRNLAEQRRLFYVGVTRAKQRVILVSSEAATNERGFSMPRSRFVNELAARLTVT